MKTKNHLTFVLGILAVSLSQGLGQTNLQFIKISQTDEQAIRLTWTSVSNKTYEIDEADQLGSTNGGATVWNQLYTEYPSQGTNTFWLDTGNYAATPPILHPKYMPLRFYRVVDLGPDTTTDEPLVSITLPTNGTIVSGELTVSVTAKTDQTSLTTELYVDGEEMPLSDDTSNYVSGTTNGIVDTYTINTCEWGNGPHTLFATARCTSDPEGAHNVPAALIGHAVSAFVPVNFSNLVTRISFSQYFFDPSAGQTQQVSAVFAANSDWTLNITDISSNTVRTATGSGTSMSFNWDGTGTGGTNLPAGIYYYYITAQTNGLAPQDLSGGGGSGGSDGTPPTPSFTSDASELWAVPTNSEDVVPLAIYPPGFDTNGLIIFSASQSEVEALTASSSSTEIAAAVDSNGDTIIPDFSGPSPQTTPSAPQRPPNNPVRGVSGIFGVAYQTYSANGSSGYTPAFPSDGVGGHVQMEGRGAANPINYTPVKESKTMANNFIKWMKHGGWSPSFDKIDDALTIANLRGSGTPFNQVSFGMLMTHGTYGTTPDYTSGANGCLQMYFPIASGASSQYLRMSEMNFGSSGTNGLKWMTLWACFSLQPDNWQNMQTAGVQPYNGNLHLLLGAGTLIYSDSHLLGYFAKYMTVGQTANNPATIRAAWYAAARKAYAGEGYSAPITFATAGDDACQNDSLQNSSTPSGTPYYDSNQVYP